MELLDIYLVSWQLKCSKKEKKCGNNQIVLFLCVVGVRENKRKEHYILSSSYVGGGWGTT